MLTSCGFTTQHHCIGAFQHSICHVSDLTAVWFTAVDHAFHHLGSNNHRFCPVNTFTDDIVLDHRDTFNRQFHSQIATCDHHGIAFDNDIAKVVYGFGLFNLGNDLGPALS